MESVAIANKRHAFRLAPCGAANRDDRLGLGGKALQRYERQGFTDMELDEIEGKR